MIQRLQKDILNKFKGFSYYRHTHHGPENESDGIAFSVQEAMALRMIIEQRINSVNPTRAISQGLARLRQVHQRATARIQNTVTDLRSRRMALKQELRLRRDEMMRAAAETGERILSGPRSVLAARGPGAATSRARPAAEDFQAQVPKVLGSDGPGRDLALGMIGLLSKAVMHGLNSTTVHRAASFEAAMERREGRGLVTVSNHVAALDDPLVTAAIVPLDKIGVPGSLRWTLCATDRCFTNPLMSAFFRTVKVLPVERGGGLEQAGMAAAEERLRAGDWVHIFPEGTRRPDGGIGPVKIGVGKLVASAAGIGPGSDSATLPPLVVPFVHSGMEGVMPKGSLLPRVGRDVHVIVGDPVPVDDLLAAHRASGGAESDLYAAIAERVGVALRDLHQQLQAEMRDAAGRGSMAADATTSGDSGAASAAGRGEAREELEASGAGRLDGAWSGSGSGSGFSLSPRARQMAALALGGAFDQGRSPIGRAAAASLAGEPRWSYRLGWGSGHAAAAGGGQAQGGEGHPMAGPGPRMLGFAAAAVAVGYA